MKKILSNVYMLAALFMIGAAITSCSKSDDTPAPEPKPVGPTTYTMTIKASKGGVAKTRALSLDGSTLNVYWSGTETIDVEQDGVIIGSATAAPSPNGNTTITATLTSAPVTTKDLNFHLGGFNKVYTGQVGLLTGTNSISEKYDYALDCIASNSYNVVGDKVTPKNPSFYLEFNAVQQAIIKFTLQDKGNSNAAINPSALTVTDGTNTVELTSIPPDTYTANGDGVLFVAFPAPGTAKTITLTAIVGNNVYTYEKSEVTFYNGSYYVINVKMTKTGVYYPTPLTLECSPDAKDGKAAVWVTYYTDLDYKVDDGEWTPYTSSINQIDLTSGHKVSFRGTNATTGASQYMQIHCNGICYIYGNIMSLLHPTNYATMTTLPYDETFKNLFMGNSYITHTNREDLVLPATTLLTQCYFQMFSGCSLLNYVKCLATSFTDETCTYEWLDGVPTGDDSGTFVKAKGASWTTGDSGIPSGWNVIEE